MSYSIHCGEIFLTVDTWDWHCEGNGWSIS